MTTHSVFLPGESHGQRCLVGYSPWGHEESDMTEDLAPPGKPNDTNNCPVLSTLLLGFLGGSDIKESACNVGDLGSIPGLGRSPGGGYGNPL